MALVRQLKTAGFRPYSRHEYIVHQLSKVLIYIIYLSLEA